MKAYLNYFKLRLITNLQYRSTAVAGILTQLFFAFVFISVYLAFYESNNTSNLPMSLSETISYMWLQQAFYALIYPYSKDKELLDMIKNGNISYELTKPIDLYNKYYIKTIASKTISTLLRFSPIIIIGLLLPFPYKLILPKSFQAFIIFLISLIIACLLISAMNTLVHIITFYTIDYKGVFNIYTSISDIFMGGIVPIPFLPKILIKIADFLPFKYISDSPFRIYSGNISISRGIENLLYSIIWTIIIIIIGKITTKKVLKKAVIMGG